MVETQSTPTRVTKKVSEVFDVSVPDSVLVEVNVERTDKVPAIDPTYTFDIGQLKKVLQWLDGKFGKNLMLTGPTGCGKSSLVEQVAARLNREVYRVACHGKMEFSELLGSTQLVQGAMQAEDGLLKKAAAGLSSLLKGAADGESILTWLQRSLSSGVVTQYVRGAAVNAATRDGILLLDEGNFLHPSTFGALNTVLDNGPLLISETGDLIIPTPDFRIAVTGNAMDGGDDLALHKGVQRMNVAMMNRFLVLRCDYMNNVQEAIVLGKTVQLPGEVVTAMIETANETRGAFKNGAIETTVSTRVLVRWAKLVQAQLRRLSQKPVDVLVETLDFALLDGSNPVDAEAIRTALRKAADGIHITLPAGAPAGAVASAQGGAVTQGLHLYAHENSGTPKIWGVLSTNTTAEALFFGQLGNNPAFETKQIGYLAQTAPSKLAKGYKEVTSGRFACADAQSDLMKLIQHWQQLRVGSIVRCEARLMPLMSSLLDAVNRSDLRPKLVSS